VGPGLCSTPKRILLYPVNIVTCPYPVNIATCLRTLNSLCWGTVGPMAEYNTWRNMRPVSQARWAPSLISLSDSRKVVRTLRCRIVSRLRLVRLPSAPSPPAHRAAARSREGSRGPACRCALKATMQLPTGRTRAAPCRGLTVRRRVGKGRAGLAWAWSGRSGRSGAAGRSGRGVRALLEPSAWPVDSWGRPGRPGDGGTGWAGRVMPGTAQAGRAQWADACSGRAGAQ
jgi:hypothetical protein